MPLMFPASTCCTVTLATVPDGGNVGPFVITISCGVRLIMFIIAHLSRPENPYAHGVPPWRGPNRAGSRTRQDRRAAARPHLGTGRALPPSHAGAEDAGPRSYGR